MIPKLFRITSGFFSYPKVQVSKKEDNQERQDVIHSHEFQQLEKQSYKIEQQEYNVEQQLKRGCSTAEDRFARDLAQR
jgi:hypothetical protein